MSVALSIPAADAAVGFEHLRRHAGRVRFVELRLDLGWSGALEALVAGAPVPVIATCRPRREGGGFEGSEGDRIAVLTAAAAAGAAFVDVEWDALGRLSLPRGARTKVIASRHWFDDLPSNLEPVCDRLRAAADVVKVAIHARSAADMIAVFRLLQQAPGPTIAIAMGTAGTLTRVLSPTFASALLTYASAPPAQGTAPGQLSIDAMVRDFAVDRLRPGAPIELRIGSSPSGATFVAPMRSASAGGFAYRLEVPAGEAPALVPLLAGCNAGWNVRLEASRAGSVGPS